MARSDNKSFPVRGVPREWLDWMDASIEAGGNRTSRNAIMLRLIEQYATGGITPKAAPPPFDPHRKPAQPYGPDTAALEISGIANETFSMFMDRAKREGWHSKNALLLELLRDCMSIDLGR